jgi:VWFA-related protein
MKRLFAPFAVFLLGAFSVAAQNQPQQANPEQSSSAIRSTAQEVLLDMVFRDKKGRTIRDVRPEEIHILEDGVEQNLTSFRLIEGKAIRSVALQGTETVDSLGVDPMREIRLVTLVFEGLDVDQKRFFREALKGILEMAPEQNLYFSILTIDQKLHVIQPFTADHSALLKSVDKSTMWSFTQYEAQSIEVKQSLKQMLSGDEPQLQSSPSGGASPAQVQSLVNYRMAKMQYDMLQAAEAADREQYARATIDALLTLVRAQSQLPGRKVVLYFNPWLFIPEVVKEQYSNLISTANRSNISFYTVDPKGLVTWSQEGAGRDYLSGATGEIRSQQMRGGVGAVSASQARAAETAEGALRANPLLWLRDLAQQTGGTAIAETNDWKAPLRTVMDEVRTYYEASYTPHITAYDGKFRKISIHVDRPDVVARTSSGYFALPQLKGGQQMYAYELPLLNSLNANAVPSDVAFQVAAERFNDHGAKVEYMVTLEAPLKEMTFAAQANQKSSMVDAALLAVLRNSKGEIVEKFSKDFAVEVALDKVDAYKAGNLVQTFRTELAPGAYTLEAVLMDRNDKKIGVEKSSVTVPEPRKSLSMSDVVVVRRTDALKDNQILDAFYFPGGKVVPTLGHTLKGGPGNILPFYFTVYPDQGVKDAPKLTMSFYKEGHYLGAAEAPLPATQRDGRIPYIANLPADKFTPGAYEIHMGITQGSSKVERVVVFQVE